MPYSGDQMKRTFFIFAIAAMLMLNAASFAQFKVTISSAERKAAEAVTADQMRSYLTFIASDAMGGRDTPSQGLDITAEFIRMNLEKWGFKPAGDDGTFFQRMYVVETSIDGARSNVEMGGNKLTYGKDFYRMPGSTDNVTNKKMVFAGDGWVIKSKNINAFDGLDIKDKVVVLYSAAPSNGRMMMGFPKGVTQA